MLRKTTICSIVIKLENFLSQMARCRQQAIWIVTLLKKKFGV